MTSFGPRITHCGASVDVGTGVNVSVGVEVGEMKTVAVSVGKRVWVGIEMSVGEGYGLAVQVGSIAMVGVGWAMKANPPQAIDKRGSNAIGTKNFLKPIKDG